MTLFEPFPKIPRLNRGMIVTEKIDGTNAQVHIVEGYDTADLTSVVTWHEGRVFTIRAGSRKRYVTRDDDNHGFAAWVWDHAEELVKLGPGRHFGEWWGSGIQRGYDLPKGEKRFSLFNVSRWLNGNNARVPELPDIVGVVPVLFRGAYSNAMIDVHIERLREHGSIASPGFDRPEGVVVWHEAARQMFKVMVEDDHLAKTAA